MKLNRERTKSDRQMRTPPEDASESLNSDICSLNGIKDDLQYITDALSKIIEYKRALIDETQKRTFVEDRQS